MFSFFSIFSNAKVKRFLSIGFVLLAMAVIMGGCDTDPDATNVAGTMPANLSGTYTTPFDSFVITGAVGTGTLQYISVYEEVDYGYMGTIKYVSNYDNKSGVIIIQYTLGAPDAAKPFHAIYYLELTASSVELNNTWDATEEDYNADTATLDEAIVKFTKKRMGDYMDIGMSTTYTRQP